MYSCFDIDKHNKTTRTKIFVFLRRKIKGFPYLNYNDKT